MFLLCDFNFGNSKVKKNPFILLDNLTESNPFLVYSLPFKCYAV